MFQSFICSQSVRFDIDLAIAGVSKFLYKTLRDLVVKGATIFAIQEIFRKSFEIGLFFTAEVTLPTSSLFGLAGGFLCGFGHFARWPG